MSNRRNRRNQKTKETGATSSPAIAQASLSPSLPPEPRAKTSRWKWIYDHHQAVASYAALVLTTVGLYIQWSQQKESDQQIEILQKSIQQSHTHETAPKLVVDTLEDDDVIHAGEGIAVKLRNVGRGVASNVIVRVHWLRFEGKPLEPECVMSRRTIAPGDSVRFRFSFPAPPEDVDDRAVIGTIGLYCQDDGRHEVLATQPFTLRLYRDERGRCIVPQFRTPNIHPVNFATRTSEKTRTEHDVAAIVDRLVVAEHDRLIKFSQTNLPPAALE